MKAKFKLLAGAVLALAFAGAAQASISLTTSSAGYSGPTLNLSSFASKVNSSGYDFTFGPVAVPNGFTFVASPGGSGGFPYGGNSGLGSVIGDGGGYGLAGNGSFGGSALYIGVDSGTGYDQLLLKNPVNQIGFYFNYAPGIGSDATISALGISGNIIGSYDLTALAPISTPGGYNEFVFRGIDSTANDIYGLQFGGNYLLIAGSPSGGIGGGAPEPTSWALLLMGGGGVGAVLRTRRRKTVAA